MKATVIVCLIVGLAGVFMALLGDHLRKLEENFAAIEARFDAMDRLISKAFNELSYVEKQIRRSDNTYETKLQAIDSDLKELNCQMYRMKTYVYNLYPEDSDVQL